MTPTVSDVKRIAEQSDPVLRNLQITHCYHQLAQAMAERFGHEANWCTFATWASKQAGQTIRKEDLIRALENFQVDEERIRTTEKFVGAMLRFGVRLESEKLVKLMWKAADPEGAFTHSSDAVARGNLKVFKEIGYEFARLNATCLPDTNYNQANITRFMDELRPGPPPDGQDYLRQAFSRYYRALVRDAGESTQRAAASGESTDRLPRTDSLTARDRRSTGSPSDHAQNVHPQPGARLLSQCKLVSQWNLSYLARLDGWWVLMHL